MHETILNLTLAILAVAVANALAPRVRLAAPILLVVFGVAASAIPRFGGLEFEPELVLVALLPPLLYAASTAMPTMDFRREFLPVGALAIFLVVITAVILGFFLAWVIPDLPIWWGIALGAVLSPTDAAAVAIAKRAHLSGRLVAILEGESLLNDATALVLLRTAVAAAAVSFSVWESIGEFLSSAIIATIIGFIVGHIILRVRAVVTEPAVSTVWSFVAPFLAVVPAEHFEASGLVAAVVAGLVTGHGAVRWLNAEQRTSDRLTWKTIEVVLEGLIFLVMGLQLTSIIRHVQDDHDSVGPAVLVAIGALAITLVVRALFLMPLLGILGRRNQLGQQIKDQFSEQRQRLIDDRQARMNIYAQLSGAESSRPGADAGDGTVANRLNLSTEQREYLQQRFGDARAQKHMTRFARFWADIEYYLAQPLGVNAGVILTWAGMRGAITLAAAQTLPADTPHRSLLILIAFIVAALSLAAQGLTLPAAVERFAPVADMERLNQQRGDIVEALRQAADEAAPADRTLANVIAREKAQYARLLKLRDIGFYESEVLEDALAALDAMQIARIARTWNDQIS